MFQMKRILMMNKKISKKTAAKRLSKMIEQFPADKYQQESEALDKASKDDIAQQLVALIGNTI